jgi:nicotinate-nucleotide adenylyltransferase
MTHSNQKKSIAILGGTFDPIHYGHILPAQHVRTWLGVDHITLLPAHIPPHKQTTTVNSIHRTAMVRLICQHEAGFICDARELNRSSHSYTVESLKEIKAESPNTQLFFIIGMDSLHTFMQWHQWEEILTLCHLVVNTRPHYHISQLPSTTQQLVKRCHYANTTPRVTLGGGLENTIDNTIDNSLDGPLDKALNNPLEKTLNSTLDRLLDKKAGYILFPPAIAHDISSTELREILDNKHNEQSVLASRLSALLPEYVINYINLHRLYKK